VTAHCGWHKNTLEEATAVIQSVDVIGEEVCEDEHAAAEVCKELIEKVVREEQLHFVKTMVGKADDLEAKYKAQSKPAEDEDGVIRSPSFPSIRVDWGRVNLPALKKLPRPDLLPVLGCSPDPTFYQKCIDTHNPGHRLARLTCQDDPANCRTAFATPACFGHKPGYATTLGNVPPPAEPLHGFVYAGGAGQATKFTIVAEAA